MDKNKQFEALAIIGGYQYNSGRGWFDCNGQRLVNGIPDYDSHDALQRIIDGLGYDETIKYILALYGAVSGGNWIYGTLIDIRYFLPLMLKATPAQKREAILRATGKWEE